MRRMQRKQSRRGMVSNGQEATMSDNATQNTDRELWREPPGDYYANSIHVTEGGGIGINVGGKVHVKPLKEWHALAERALRAADPAPAREPEIVARPDHHPLDKLYADPQFQVEYHKALARERAAEPEPAEGAPQQWRVGGKVPLNVYEGDRPMFQCHTPEDAARIVALLNQAPGAAPAPAPVTPQDLLQLIESIVGDDFCEDLDCRAAFHGEKLSATEKTAHGKLSMIYRIVHSHITEHTCYSVHDDWRALTLDWMAKR